MTASSGNPIQDDLEDAFLALINGAMDDGLSLEDIDDSLSEMHLLVGRMSQHMAVLQAAEAKAKGLH